jgi:tetraacyldisaccharide 4'-kinase
VDLKPGEWRAIVRGETRGLRAFALRRLLWLARIPYALGVAWKNRKADRLTDVSRAVVPVISIGNLTVGGTGKTPCVEFVAGLLRDGDRQVAILSRGYGSEAGRNDEAMVLEENLPDVPHLQGRDRVALAATAIEELESDVLVLDDGFQHRRLARDLDIVLIDATEPFEREYLFPRGALREPLGSLRRAGSVVVTRADQVSAERLKDLRDAIRRIVPAVPIATTTHEPKRLLRIDDDRDPSELHGKTVFAFCGLGNPPAFRRTLEQLGATLGDFRTFPDHHPYTKHDVESLAAWAAQAPEGTWIVTTQKDWVKIRLADLGGKPLYALRIGLTFLDGREEFELTIRSKIDRDS